MTTRWLWVAFAGLTLVAPVMQAQEAGGAVFHKEIRVLPGTLNLEQGPGPVTMNFIDAEMSFNSKPVKGAPYSADAITETTQTLSDGNRITRKSTASVYRDSEGRTRREETLGAIGPWAAGGDPPQIISINDPVAGVNYHLDPQAHTAHKLILGKEGFAYSEIGVPGSADKVYTFRRELPPPAAGIAGGAGSTATVTSTLAVPAAKLVKPDAKTESLGKQGIEGVTAEGTRSTVTLPAGAIGNERPIESTSERWYSPELQTVVLSKRSDPRFGETVYRLINIQRAEPPATLFLVPPDYSVSEDAGGPGDRVMRLIKKADEAKEPK